MYKLTLTLSERKAIDWVGNRYATGWDFYQELVFNCKQLEEEGIDWDSDKDITFLIPEHVAWSIMELFEDEKMLFPCYSPEFVTKLMEFYNQIV
jgi:hypothetical protein